MTESKRKLNTHDRAATERALLEAAATLFSRLNSLLMISSASSVV